MWRNTRTWTATGLALGILATAAATAQAPEPPLGETRLTVNTLVREDLFAGFLRNDRERFGRGERNLELLLDQRPAEKPSLLAWKASAALYRAVLAHESEQDEEFARLHRRALAAFDEARRIGPRDAGVPAITGGAFAILADRLPEAQRAAGWARAYDAYQLLWKQQGAVVERLPAHIRGELLAGLAQSAQRTGRTQEMQQSLERMLTLLRDTPYEASAREWKRDPGVAATGKLVCRSCHEPGRLADRLELLKK
jgi:hypothetical protein